MKFEKVFEADWPMCYVASSLKIDGNVYAAFASESHDTTGAILAEPSGKTLPLWDTPGGCMGIVQIPGLNEFLTIQKFYPIFQSERAEIAWFFQRDGIWNRKVLLTVPFVHRIEILQEHGRYYLLICQLCREKAFTDDWSSPGCVSVCSLDLPVRSCGPATILLDSLYQNHGLIKFRRDDDCVLVAHRDGIHEIAMNTDGQWTIEQLYDQPCSDVALTALDSNGSVSELGVIRPFHGAAFQIIRRQGKHWHTVFSLQDAFGHGIWGGHLAGQAVYLVGFRGGTRGTFCISSSPDVIEVTAISSNAGAANLTAFSRDGKDYVAAADRESNRCAIYCVVPSN